MTELTGEIPLDLTNADKHTRNVVHASMILFRISDKDNTGEINKHPPRVKAVQYQVLRKLLISELSQSIRDSEEDLKLF